MFGPKHSSSAHILAAHKGDTLHLSHQLKHGVWEASLGASKVRCVVLNEGATIASPAEHSIMCSSNDPHPIETLSEISSMPREELIQAIQMLLAGSHSFLLSEIDSIRNELDQAELTLKQLIRTWTCLYGSPDLLEKTYAHGCGYTEIEKAKLPLMSNPYICVLTEEYIRENKPSNQLMELAKEGWEQTDLLIKLRRRSHSLLNKTFYNQITSVVRQSESESLLSLKFNVLALDRGIANTYERENHMIVLLMHMFIHLDLVREFNIPMENLFRFIGTIARRYRNVPFHCFYHAFNVTQTMYYFLTTCNIKKIFGESKLEVFACLVSCLIHDCDHPGLNNTFQKKYNSKLSRVHSSSILENHHLNQGLCVLSQPDCDILTGLSDANMALFHRYLHQMVMATDLAFHKRILEELTPLKENIRKEFEKPKPTIDEPSTLAILALVMKCSDLSNEIRPCDIAFLWAARVTNEFFQQTDKERALGLPVTDFMDPQKINPAQEQENFINGLCKPLYGALRDIFPTVEPCLAQMMSNLAVWEKRRLDSKAPLCLARSGWEEDQDVTSPTLNPPTAPLPDKEKQSAPPKPTKKKWYNIN